MILEQNASAIIRALYPPVRCDTLRKGSEHGRGLGCGLAQSNVPRRTDPAILRLELVLRDNTRHCLHSIVAFEEETRTLCARIWDLRAFLPKEIDELRLRLNSIRTRKELSPASGVHPKLDWANLHLHFEDIAYCVEWHDRLWPEDARPKIGFATQAK
jgi:hypothetical protein